MWASFSFLLCCPSAFPGRTNGRSSLPREPKVFRELSPAPPDIHGARRTQDTSRGYLKMADAPREKRERKQVEVFKPATEEKTLEIKKVGPSVSSAEE